MRLRSLLREPLLHFLAAGAALFLWFQWSGGGTGPTSTRIVLTSGQIEHLASGFARTWQRPPEEAELKGLVDEWVREEIAVRESMAMGLDRDDTVIRRRLRQKLEFLVEDLAVTAPPTEPELESWLAAHADRFRTETKVAFRQVYLSRDRRGASAEADARALLSRLAAAGAEAPIEELGDRLMLPQEHQLSTASEIARLFGDAFAQRLESTAPGSWTGPVESGYGLHLVLVRDRVEGSVPPLDQVRAAVESALLADRRARQLAATYERLLMKYSVVVEGRRAGETAKGGS